MQQPIFLPHVTKLVDLILIEVFLLTKVLQEGDKYGVTSVMSCHVMSPTLNSSMDMDMILVVSPPSPSSLAFCWSLSRSTT